MQELLKQALINYKLGNAVKKPLEVKSNAIILKERIFIKNKSEKLAPTNLQSRNLSRCKNSEIIRKRKRLEFNSSDYKCTESAETMKDYTDFFPGSFMKLKRNKTKKAGERKSKSWGELPKMQPIKKVNNTEIMINLKNLVKSRMECKTVYYRIGDLNLSPWR